MLALDETTTQTIYIPFSPSIEKDNHHQHHFSLTISHLFTSLFMRYSCRDTSISHNSFVRTRKTSNVCHIILSCAHTLGACLC